jgi:adenylyltransferase/sulfurtransferase
VVAALSAEPSILLLDVREPHEWEIGNLEPKGAFLMPFGEVRERAEELPRDRPIVVYCHVGVRSALVGEMLRALGFDRVSNMTGGYRAWVEEVDPTLPRY